MLQFHRMRQIKLFSAFAVFLVGVVVLGRAQSFGASTQDEQIPVGAIDFYGYGGIEVTKLQTALPVKVGDKFPSYESLRAMAPKIRKVVLEFTGKPAVGVNNVAIEGSYLIYIGLSGSTMKTFPVKMEFKGTARLPENILDLYQQKMDISLKAVAAGAAEDESKGYAISADPNLRAKQLAIRGYALEHEDLVREVLESSADAKQRIVAADVLGYAQQSSRQIEALVSACSDPDSIVRNNATRALAVLASSDPKVAAKIPATTFIQMLSSEKWTDRNKAGFLLESITGNRDPKVLSQLRAEALDSLIEMARWREAGHAHPYRVLLGRIGQIEEVRLQKIADQYDQVDTIIAAAREHSS